MDTTSVSRLSEYGLTAADVFPDALVVPPGKSLTLSAPAAGVKKAGYVTLTPKTIDDVKRWIGVPDSVGKKRTLTALPQSDLAILAKPGSLTEAHRTELSGGWTTTTNGPARTRMFCRPCWRRLAGAAGTPQD